MCKREERNLKTEEERKTLWTVRMVEDPPAYPVDSFFFYYSEGNNGSIRYSLMIFRSN